MCFTGRIRRFHETNSSSDACEIMLGMGQPLHNFVSEVFDQYGNARLDLDDAFSAYVGWHERNSPGTRPMAKGKFKAEIQTINLGVKVVRSRVGDRRDEVLVGLKPTADFEDLLSAGRAERGLQDYQTQSF